MHKQEKVITKEDQAKLRSMCCDAQCTYGQRHEYGKQYCSKCKEPCIWRAP